MTRRFLEHFQKGVLGNSRKAFAPHHDIFCLLFADVRLGDGSLRIFDQKVLSDEWDDTFAFKALLEVVKGLLDLIGNNDMAADVLRRQHRCPRTRRQ